MEIEASGGDMRSNVLRLLVLATSRPRRGAKRRRKPADIEIPIALQMLVSVSDPRLEKRPAQTPHGYKLSAPAGVRNPKAADH